PSHFFAALEGRPRVGLLRFRGARLPQSIYFNCLIGALTHYGSELSRLEMTAQLPALFLSHGSPMLVFEDIPARHFMAGLGRALERPKAILCISAHCETERPAVSAATSLETIHDFYGFPDELYRIHYAAPGAPALARRTAELLEDAGIGAAIDGDRGLDHGAWNPLLLIYPKADVPVTQLSIQS